MARKVEDVIVPDSFGPRDGGKMFRITEWPARLGEQWVIRMANCLNRGQDDVDVQALIGRGMEAIFWLGARVLLRGNVNSDEFIPIFDQLLECVQIIRDPNARNVTTGERVATAIVSDDDIEEIKTRLWLRSEVLRVHVGFSPADALGNLLSLIMTKTPETSTST